MDENTIMFCNDEVPKICYTASQDLLNYIDTTSMNWKDILDKQVGMNMIFTSLIIFFLFMITLKLYFANKKW
jgi:hypothetical protein